MTTAKKKTVRVPLMGDTYTDVRRYVYGLAIERFGFAPTDMDSVNSWIQETIVAIYKKLAMQHFEHWKLHKDISIADASNGGREHE